MLDLISLSDTIFEIHFNKDTPSMTIYWNWWFIIVLLLLILIWRLYLNKYLKKLKDKFFLDKVKIKIKVGNVEIEKEITLNYQNKFIANRIYIELVTRKAAIPVDEENDVIIEIYNSWYSLFSIIRNEIKNLPGEFINGQKSTQDLIDLTIKILNEGLRPHLTK